MPTTNTNAKTDWKKNELGVLWKRESKSGEKYLVGTLTFNGQEVQVVAFSNKNKKADNQPDIRVYISEKTGVTPNPAPKQVVKATTSKAPVAEQAPAESNETELL